MHGKLVTFERDNMLEECEYSKTDMVAPTLVAGSSVSASAPISGPMRASQPTTKCFVCGESGHMKDQCWHYKLHGACFCRNCGLKGHKKSNCTRPPKYNSNVVRKDSQHPQRTGLLQTPRAQNGKNLTQSLNRWNRITPMTTQYNNGQSSFGCSSDVGRTYVDVLNGVNVVCTAV